MNLVTRYVCLDLEGETVFRIYERKGRYGIAWGQGVYQGSFPYTKQMLDKWLNTLSRGWVEDEVFIAKRIISSYEV